MAKDRSSGLLLFLAPDVAPGTAFCGGRLGAGAR